MSSPKRPRPMTPRARLRRGLGLALLLSAGVGAAGCDHGGDEAKAVHAESAKKKAEQAQAPSSRVVPLERRDIRMKVLQPGTIQAFESTPVYPRIAGYVDKYRFNIGDRVKAGDVLLDMWIPDLVEQLAQKTAAAKRAEVQIRVADSAARAAVSRLENAEARIASAQAGVKRAQAAYTRWESEYKRLDQLVTSRVLDRQVRDETYRQFEESAAARDQATAMVAEANASRDVAIADRDRAAVDVEAAKADYTVAQSEESLAKVFVDYGKVKAPYDGVITQRNVSPGDYLQAGGGTGGRPLFMLEQIDPVRVFMGVPELASAFIHDGDTALISIQAIAGDARVGKIVRSGFSLNPSTRTLQVEIDIPNPTSFLRPGMYVNVSIAIDRKQVLAVPSNAIAFEGQHNYFVYFEEGGKSVRTPVLIGPSDDAYTEILRKRPLGSEADAWVPLDGKERIVIGSFDAMASASPGAKGAATTTGAPSTPAR